MKKVLVVMGSDSDLKVMEKCVDRLKSFDIPTEVRICSAHRTPAVAEQLAKNAAAKASALSSRQPARPHISAVYWRLTPRFR